MAMSKDWVAPPWSSFGAASLAVGHITEVCKNVTDVMIYLVVWGIPSGLVGSALFKRIAQVSRVAASD
jgi:hypothetical protein